jgi:hypothetical protein
MTIISYSIVYIMLSFFWNEGIIHRAENGVTLKASSEALVGKEYLFEGRMFLIVDDSLLRKVVKDEMDLSRVITSRVTNMSYLFYKSTLQDPNISSWDVSAVKNMSWMFGLAPVINPDISFWDTRSVVDFSDMFIGAKKFRGDLSKWNTSSGERFNGMFFETEFNGYLNDWDMSSAKNLSGMFDDARLFDQPLDKWNLSNAEDLGGMFAEAESFDQDITKWDVRNVKVMTNMFRNASKFKRDLSNWEVPLIKLEPENFSVNSPLKSPKWNIEISKKKSFTWYYLLLGLIIIPSILILIKVKGRKPRPVQVLEKDVIEALRVFLIQNNTNQINRENLDEILGIIPKTLDAQKRIRSNFIREFNSSGQGEITRVRDSFDSRSFNYLVTWNKSK